MTRALPVQTTPGTEERKMSGAHRYPLYAVQWHPEESSFEWIDKPGTVHSAAAVRASFYTGSFSVSEAMMKS
ncbi:Gamma-glutamyl hydrolase [Liparis tanakae]|uniref:Gamma-glutamyl hydrolase n=1 Tax=Liparis tanakae TaxID=230148 RepID=A0A4Z2EXP0_9TELE|nr:Gamma-glutamyl hydrolase [Liparis tanakae]